MDGVVQTLASNLERTTKAGTGRVRPGRTRQLRRYGRTRDVRVFANSTVCAARGSHDPAAGCGPHHP